MKIMKIILISIIPLLFLSSLSSTQINVVGEVFTATWCQYCPEAREGLADLAEQENYVVPLIWSEIYQASPNYTSRKLMYGVNPLPHAQFQGFESIVGITNPGVNMLPEYTDMYNQLVNIDSPFAIDLILNVNEYNEFELTANVEVTGTVNSEEVNKALFILTYNYEYTYSCVVQRYDEQDFDLAETGQSDTFTHTFTGDDSWDLSKVRAVFMIQKWNGSMCNYPIHQAAIADFPLNIPEPQANMELFINQTEEINLSNYFYYHDQPANGEITVTSSDNEVVSATMNGNILTLECGNSVGLSTIELTCVSGIYTLSSSFYVYVICSETSELDYALPDSPEQAAYPNNPNEYENSYIDLGWTSIDIPVTADLISINIQCNWQSYDYPSEGSFWVCTPSGTSYNLFNSNSIQPLELDIEVIDLIGESVNGTWIFYILDSYGDGGHQVTNMDVTFTLAGVVSTEDSEINHTAFLTGNYPNPFHLSLSGRSPCTTIYFSTNIAGNVDIEIFNLKGQKVKTLLSGLLPADNHSVTWNGTDDTGNTVTCGVYLYRIATSDYFSIRKMMLLK